MGLAAQSNSGYGSMLNKAFSPVAVSECLPASKGPAIISSHIIFATMELYVIHNGDPVAYAPTCGPVQRARSLFRSMAALRALWLNDEVGGWRVHVMVACLIAGPV